MQYLFISYKEFKRDGLKRKKNDLLANPLRKSEAISRQDMQTIQLATLTGICCNRPGNVYSS
jgi:hypothetical protein